MDDDTIEGLAAEIGLRLPWSPRRRSSRPQGGRPRPSGLALFRGGAQSQQQQRVQQAVLDTVPDVAGVPSRDVALVPAAWAPFAFTNATGTNSIQLTMNPQAPFRGRRLVGTVLRSGASAALTAPVITSLQVGMKPIILSPDGVPIEALLQGGFDNNLLLPPTQPGTLYSLTMRLPTALGAGDTITAIIGLTGTSVL